MSRLTTYCLFLLGAWALLSCGSGSSFQVAVVLTPTTALTDANAYDLIIIAEGQNVGGSFPDLDGDGQPDTFVYPEACGSTIPAGCGTSIQTGVTVAIGELPTNYYYLMRASVRNVSVATVHTKRVQYLNDGNAPQININLTAVSP